MIPIFDLHCHPSIKVYLCNAQIAKAHEPSSDFIPGGMHVDLPGMQIGGVQCIVSFQYVPEVGITQMPLAHFAIDILKALHVDIVTKLQQDVDGNACFDQAMQGIQSLNAQVTNATNFNVALPTNLAEFNAAIAANQTIILHGLEGSHHLGRNLGDPQNYLDNLQKFKDAGVNVLTLSHFFQNDVTGSGGGIPPQEAKMLGYKRTSLNVGLSAIGEQVINWCQDNGIIIDLVHSPVATRNRVYEILDERKAAGKRVRPIVFSHTGVRIMATEKMFDQDDLRVLPAMEEVLKIRSYGGVLGMILMNYWQTGEEDQDTILVNDAGISFVIDTMKWIKELTRDVANIAIGTDLDGFTTIPRDVRHVKFIDSLRQAIIEAFGPDDAALICSGNVLRVLRDNFS